MREKRSRRGRDAELARTPLVVIADLGVEIESVTSDAPSIVRSNKIADVSGVWTEEDIPTRVGAEDA